MERLGWLEEGGGPCALLNPPPLSRGAASRITPWEMSGERPPSRAPPPAPGAPPSGAGCPAPGGSEGTKWPEIPPGCAQTPPGPPARGPPTSGGNLGPPPAAPRGRGPPRHLPKSSARGRFPKFSEIFRNFPKFRFGPFRPEPHRKGALGRAEPLEEASATCRSPDWRPSSSPTSENRDV